MKKIIIPIILAVVSMNGKLLAQAGTLDPTFGNGGIVVTHTPLQNEALCMEIQSDGKIVVGGYSGNAGGQDFSMSRYNANGTLDNSFGTGGIVVTTMSSNGDDVCEAVLIRPDGKIIMVGYAYLAQTNVQVALARYLSNGTLDTTFGVQGKVLTVVGNGMDYGFSALLQPDGKILVSGYSANGSGGDIALVRYNSDGSLDASFGTNGKVMADMVGNADHAFKVLLQPDGKIVTPVYMNNGTTYVFGVARFNSDGSFDNTFGNGGKVINMIGTTEDVAESAVLQPDGKIVVVGYSWNPGYTDTDLAMARYNSDGSLDTTFGNGGKVLAPIGTTYDYLRSVTLQSDGKIVAVGETNIGSSADFAVVRFNTDGSFDTSFNSTGISIEDVGAGEGDLAMFVEMQTDGKIVVAGSTIYNQDVDIAIVRYLSGLELGVVDFSLDNNSVFVYPNPISATATLEYTLLQTENISLDITDMQGKKICSLVNGEMQESGKHEQHFTLPETLAAGTYLLVLSTEKGKVSVKIVK